jgi:flavocytochrome c
MSDFDVVIIGSGAAGLAAAFTAAEHGASVLVAEAEDVVGGSSRLASGMLMGAGTRLQRALGIEDGPESLYREYMQVNQWNVEPGLAQRLAFESGPAIEWLADLGVSFHDTLSYGGEEGQPRNHLPVELGAGVVEVLRREAVNRGVEIALRRRVDQLLVEDGSVVGVSVDGDELTAGATVVATGGFGANPELLALHYPTPTTAGDWMWYLGADGARGDALALADQVGAQVAGHGRGLCFLSPNFVHEYEATLPGWLLVVNAGGQRFCDETVAYGVLDRLVRNQGDRAFVVFDEPARQGAPTGEPAAYRTSNPSMPGRRSPNWNDEMIKDMARQAAIATADSIPELATMLGLPADVLAGTVARYNQFVADGEDRDFLKAGSFLKPIATPPFYGAELRLATIAMTSVGLRIDVDAHVIDRVGRAIPGLFAAGECTGGVLGDVYVGSGNSFSNCIVFGRTAGRSSALSALGGKNR